MAACPSDLVYHTHFCTPLKLAAKSFSVTDVVVGEVAMRVVEADCLEPTRCWLTFLIGEVVRSQHFRFNLSLARHLEMKDDVRLTGGKGEKGRLRRRRMMDRREDQRSRMLSGISTERGNSIRIQEMKLTAEDVIVHDSQ
jgi:hypothetical protein